MSNYYDGLNTKLLEAIPPAGKILELGCANGRMGRRYKEFHHGAIWVGVDVCQEALDIASKHLDQVHKLDLDTADLCFLGNDYDAIVFGDLLEHLKEPEGFLEKLRFLCKPTTLLICCIPNMAHISVVERLLMGDISYDNEGLLDRTHLRFFSPRSIIKNFLDSGWMPKLVGYYDSGSKNEALVKQLLLAGQQLGSPQQTSLEHLLLYQMIYSCTLLEQIKPAKNEPKISFVVPTNNVTQLELNVLSSPGIKEINGEVIPVENAGSPAHALEFGQKSAQNDWIIFCHQDIYFPKGSGHQIAQCLSGIPQEDRSKALIGFAGITENSSKQSVESGLVLDRIYLFDHPVNSMVTSLDELAIIVHKDSIHLPDSSLGWHLWGTDLCLKASLDCIKSHIKIIRVPIFHNSLNDANLSEDFERSRQLLRNKYPMFPRIKTLCTEILQ